MSTDQSTDSNTKSGPIARLRAGIAWLNANRKRFFWWWITYQAVKGAITLSLIWVPLLLIWLRSRGEA